MATLVVVLGFCVNVIADLSKEARGCGVAAPLWGMGVRLSSFKTTRSLTMDKAFGVLENHMATFSVTLQLDRI